MTGVFRFDTAPMRVLVGCETSGRVRDALIRRGHDAVSCDLLPSTVPGPHIQGDVLQVLDDGWDMGIFFPPCPKLTVAAAWCLYHPDDKHLPAGRRRPHPDFPNRRQEQDEAAAFFMRFVEARIRRKAIENPTGAMSTRYRQPDQVIQPYWFGEDASKATCLWLFELPLIPVPPRTLWHPGRKVEWPPGSGRIRRRWSNQTDSGQNKLSPTDDRWAKRSETYPGIAEAFAENWG